MSFPFIQMKTNTHLFFHLCTSAHALLSSYWQQSFVPKQSSFKYSFRKTTPTTLDVAGTQASHSCVHLSEHQFTVFLALALITRQKNLSYPPGEALNCWFFLPFPAKPLLPPELNVQPQHTWGLGGRCGSLLSPCPPWQNPTWQNCWLEISFIENLLRCFLSKWVCSC